MDRTIIGKIDEYGFAYIPVVIVSNGVEMDAKAIIDTGAAYCIVQKELISQLNLQPFKPTVIHHPQFGEIQSNDYLIDMVVDFDNPNGGCLFKGLRVGELYDSNYPAAIILGVDFLKYFHFEYNGTDKTVTLKIRA
jgi:hypothetical protein